jgi:2-dehydropantoate 2-reductase
VKIAVFGAGAMGSLYAARFAMAGHSVVAVDPWEAHVSAINASGLRMRGPDGDHHIKGIQALFHLILPKTPSLWLSPQRPPL